MKLKYEFFQCSSTNNFLKIKHNFSPFFPLNFFLLSSEFSKFLFKQAGNGPSRRHIEGSKIAKGLQNFQVLVNWDYFYEKFFLKKSFTMSKKTERGDPLGFFNIHSVAKLQKNEGGLSWGKKFEKSRTVPKKWTLWSPPVLYVTRKTFLVQFLGQTGTFWRLLKIL